MMDGDALVIYVNGLRRELASIPSSDLTLLSYLRGELGLCGTRSVCGEGACGACTVTVSRWNGQRKEVEHSPVNACITKICSLHGAAITTVEGLGSTKTKLHPVQERIFKAHGSQCGFCTPGMVMSMSTALRNKNDKSLEPLDIEDILQGNLCRCTGYRPILEGFSTFCKDGSKKKESGRANDGCRTVPTFSSEDFAPYSEASDPDFPAELKGNEFTEKSICFVPASGPKWHRPSSVEELKQIVEKYGGGNVKFVAGGTGAYGNSPGSEKKIDAVVQVSNLSAGRNVSESREEVFFGGALTMEEFGKACETYSQKHGGVFRALSSALGRWVSPQVRARATLGGHLGWAHPCSDVLPLFMAARCEVELLVLSSGTVKKIQLEDSSGLDDLKAELESGGALITGLKVPISQKGAVCLYYREGRRKEMDLPVANVAFFGTRENGKVTDLRIVAGGAEANLPNSKKSKPELLEKTAKFLLGKAACEEVSRSALMEKIVEELPVDGRAPGKMAEYRRCLVAGFVERFLVDVGKENRKEVKDRDPVEGHQLFEMPPEDQDESDALRRPIQHQWAAEQTTGEAKYVCDMPRYNNEVWVIPVLSDSPHGLIKRIDFSAALAVEGVVGSMTSADVADNWWGLIAHDEEIMASEAVYAGQVVGAIACSDYDAGRRAAGMVRVEMEAREHQLHFSDVVERNDPGDEIGKRCTVVKKSTGMSNDADSVVRVSGEFSMAAQRHVFFEAQSALAVPSGEKDELTVWAGTQFPNGIQQAVSKALEIPRHKVVVKCKRAGGGFGGKERANVPLLAAIAAKKFNRPARIALTPAEDGAVTGHRPSWLIRYDAAADSRTGRVLDVKVDALTNAGASLDLSANMAYKMLLNADGGYTWHGGFDGQVKVLRTNSVSATAFRGFGNPEGCLVAEQMVEHLAQVLGRDPRLLREANMTKEGDHLHYGDMVVEGCTLDECWGELMKKSNYLKRKKAIDDFNSGSKVVKRGITALPMKFAIGLPRKGNMQGTAYIRIYADGSVLLSHGATELGQGINTKMMQVCSRSLGVALDRIHIAETSTDSVANATATVGSLGSDLNGPAVADACRQLREALRPAVEEAGEGASWNEVVAEAFGQRIGLSAVGHFENPIVDLNVETNRGRMSNYHTFGAGCIEVEVDCHTGDVSVLSAQLVMDLGKSLNPALDVGQVEGAFVQGLGYVTTEQVLQSPETGRFVTQNMSSYMIPTVADVPRRFDVTLLSHKEGRPTSACYSSKGVGEPPLVLAMGVPAAVRHALASYRSDHGEPGWFRLDVPLTRDKVRAAARDDFVRAAEEKMPAVPKEERVANEV